MTYRAGSTAMTNGQHQGSTPSTNPTIPSPSGAALYQSGQERVYGRLPSTNLHVGVPIEPSRPELAYQEMVGNTGVMGSRNGDSGRANGAVNGIAKGEKSNGSSCQPVLVPGPNGGFIPPEMLASNGISKREEQRARWSRT